MAKAGAEVGNKLSSPRNNNMNSTDLERGVASGGPRISSSDKKVVRPLWMGVLHRVPQGLREKKEQLYDPSLMSLGPYHHGRPQLRQLEAFKEKVEKLMLEEEERRLIFRGRILERIDDIRHFYGGLSRDEFDDDVLADMMLRDACTLLYWMEINARKYHQGKAMLVEKHLGLCQAFLVWNDVVKLENQIPWWLMKSLISLTYEDEEKGRDLIVKCLSFQAFANGEDLKQLPWDDDGDGDEYIPLHFLEAIRNTSPIVMDMINNDGTKDGSSGGLLMPGKRLFRSVRELKAKGIYIKRNSHFIGKITFRSYYVFGVLHLPVLVVSKDTNMAFSNIMALEMSPGSPSADSTLTSYFTFMKSMIQSSEDVKLLQEKGIIVSFVDDHEEIVRMFKKMDTYATNMVSIYNEIKIRINHHCNSKSRTWIADLINTNFSSPWTVIALLAAAFLLCLTFLQTYYTINPK